MASSSSFFYDVFLSFRGTDTRYGFTGNLYKALSDAGIRTFIDDEELQRGEEITSSLLKDIKDSRNAIIVLSKNYASSSFCLEELSNIIDHVYRKGRLVFPIFYKVDPSDVRHQRCSYGEALVNHEKKFNANKERLQKWRTALQLVANLSGFHLEHGDRSYEYDFIERIVKDVSSKINRVPLSVAKHPVGLESRVEEVKLLMDMESDDRVHMVGIHGIGGVGKTTLGLAVYNSVAEYFTCLCFLQNVRENSNSKGLSHLQEILLSEMFGGKKIEFASIQKGILEIQNRLHRKKVLLILDDVDKLEQLDAVAGSPNWFGPGSRVIITTRDKQLLACHKVEKIYEAKELNRKDALQLLRWNAFKTDSVDPSYTNVLNRALTHTFGLPLALVVIGSNMFGKSIGDWESALNEYEKNGNKKIQEILKVSYDALEGKEKSVFLDIACCFKGYPLENVQDILNAHYGEGMNYHVKVLVEKSLIKIDLYGKVTLHDLIEDMGKEIVRQESPNNPGERSRLWFHKDIVDVLEEDMGTNKIGIIYWKPPHFDKEVGWSGKAFAKMKNLKTLIISGGCFSKPPEHLPNSLRILEWEGYPSQYLPSDFHPKKLFICKIFYSRFTSPESLQKCVNIRVLRFDSCGGLTHIPDVSGLPHLEELSFHLCWKLTTIHDSVGLVDKLRILNCSYCTRLRAFPPLKLTSLEELDLVGCSRLESFPEILGEMKNIKYLDLSQTHIKELPSSFENLTGLRELRATDCGIVQLPSSIVKMRELAVIVGMRLNLGSLPKVGSMVSSNIERLELKSCNVSDEFLAMGLTWFANVKYLNLSGNKFTIIPECIKECHLLRKLNLDDCWKLREIRGIPPNLNHFSAAKCSSLTFKSISKLLDQKLHEAGNTRFCLPGIIGMPEWFESSNRMRRPISFWFRNKFPAIAALCFGNDWNNATTLIINGNKGFETGWPDNQLWDHTYLFGMQPEDHIKLDEVPLKNEWNRVEVKCESRIGIHVFKDKNSTEDIRFTNPDLSSNYLILNVTKDGL
ncbi:disease resistance protein Roq1-like [Gastrolobium bilobum]|uniref:disease resistance protein Roq1-like n=1 Tax=Gastrolobium bilobum TaxID=150636 RepID=UPI002AB01EFE|nr:disease resistance protein Roq1-like [Gastrolobium bilobum]